MPTQTHTTPRWDRWTADAAGTSLVRPQRAPRPVRFDAEPGPVEIDLACTALVIVDMQNDFLHRDGWFAAALGESVGALSAPIAVINPLAAQLRAHGVPVLHLNWGVRADLANLPATVRDKASGCGTRPAYGDATDRGRILVQGDWGAASVAGIDASPQDLTVHKHRLSGFRDNEFDQILRRRGVTTLLYTGVNIDRCVFATLMDGAFQGYDSILVEDGCATTSPPHVTDAILYLVRLLYGFTARSDAILTALPSPHPDPET